MSDCAEIHLDKHADKCYSVFTKPYNYGGPNANFVFYRRNDGSFAVSGSADKYYVGKIREILERGLSELDR